ncbi:hypothetical protein [Pontibaca salina]|uniref:Lipoprotein n=1 Tax=Pontibaca salina TaxID=2795731 RepID=A0A934M166_9RHOB|nr:hypothetical protein [Pontibaca salina]MBI6630463.1 hypothetical protein [Pontibaca salina]
MFNKLSYGHRPAKRVALPLITVAMVGVAGFLAACKTDEAEAGNGGDVQAEVEALLDGVAAGQSGLRVTGAVTSSDLVFVDPAGRPTAEFRPARQSRATYSRNGNNADGPYRIIARTGVSDPSGEQDIVGSWVTVVLPAKAAPGAYKVASGRAAKDNEAQASLTGEHYNWAFGDKVQGDLYVAEIGDSLTAAWDFTAQNKSGEMVEIKGGVKELAFWPQQETKYTISINGETDEKSGRMSAHRAGGVGATLLPGRGIYLELPAEIDTGTYPLLRHRSDNPNGVVLNLPDQSYEAVNGEMTFERDGNYLHGTFKATTSGEDVVTLDGSFSYVVLPDA